MDIFQYIDYRDYLKERFSGTGSTRGTRVKLAKYIRCQTSFINQVLTKRINLSLEHAIKVTQFLNFNSEESEYFMLLVHFQKAGSRDLEIYYEKRIQIIKNNRNKIKSRINDHFDLLPAVQMEYYSTWHCAAIHVLAVLPNFGEAGIISQRLNLDINLVKEKLYFLEKNNFLVNDNGKYKFGKQRYHLPSDSSMLPRHHNNWRMKSMEAIDSRNGKNLHYSLLMGISKNDANIIRKKLLNFIEQLEPIISESNEEDAYAFNCDLFKL